jgi:hypothetical protein
MEKLFRMFEEQNSQI